MARKLIVAIIVLTSALSVAVAAPTDLEVDCVEVNPDCPPIEIRDEPGLDGGRADPSVEHAPGRRRIWMAYSWPHRSGAGGGSTAVDSRLAYSRDGGRRWRFQRELWTSRPTVDPLTGAPAHFNEETVSLEARNRKHRSVQGRRSRPAGQVWYSARYRYLIRDRGPPRVSTFELRVAKAQRPGKLARVDEQSLGGGPNPDGAVDFDLSTLAPELAGCSFTDPGLHYEDEDDRLYLAAQCFLFSSGGHDYENEFIALFKARPEGPVDGWRWRYVGELTDREDALDLGGESLLQVDLARSREGRLIALVSPSGPAPGPLEAHYGCRALELRSLDPPRLRRDPSGRPKVLASVTAVDLLPEGPSSCGYDRSSRTGIVIARRDFSAGLEASLRASGLRP
jgi:hypothetical protein